ncbi:MAG: N-acetylmuramoyl-L-alanine amidase [Desulfovibrionaceae bacterium]|nr:N-acetylmuramoyl-L-alanine amidase [Desulfovibrionaceae bacterium]
MRLRFFFALLLCLFAVLNGPQASHAAAAPSQEQLYSSACSRLTALERNPGLAKFRDRWLGPIRQLDELYEQSANSPLRPDILFQSARGYRGLFGSSHSKDDADQAVQRLLRLAADYPGHPKAAEALLSAARLKSSVFKAHADARRILEQIQKQYAGSSTAKNAARLLAQLPAGNEASPPGKASSPSAPPNDAEGLKVTAISWSSRPASAQFTITLSTQTPWAAFSQKKSAKGDQPARLVIELPETVPAQKLPQGARCGHGIFRRMQVSLNAAGTTRIILDFSDFRSFTVTEKGNALIINVSNTLQGAAGAVPIGQNLGSGGRANPRPISSEGDLARLPGLPVKTIVLDAGHGGNDGGTAHFDLIEKNITLDTTQRVARYLRRAGLKIQFTRDRDTRVELEERTRIANRVGADLFVSIHVNANQREACSGFECYYLNYSSSRSSSRVASTENTASGRNENELRSLIKGVAINSRTHKSRLLAHCIQSAALSYVKSQRYPLRNGGVRSAPFWVLVGTQMPAVLIEIGYCTNPDEAKKLGSEQYREVLARGIAEGIKNYVKNLTKSK